MTALERSPGRVFGYHVDAPAENLLFAAFRCWTAGYSTGDVACWDLAWEVIAGEVPAETAKPLYGEFHHFVRCLRQCAVRDINARPIACKALCRDECLVLAMMEAAQRRDHDRLGVVAANLLATEDCGPALTAALALAAALARAGFVIAPVNPDALGELLRTPDRSVSVH